jgi:hypothetical protein
LKTPALRLGFFSWQPQKQSAAASAPLHRIVDRQIATGQTEENL